MRIALFIRTLGIGGTERQVQLLASGLKEAGHEVEVVCFYEEPGFGGLFQAMGLKVYYLDQIGGGGWRGRWREAARLFKEGGFDIVISYLDSANLLAAGLKLTGDPFRLVWNLRGMKSWVEALKSGSGLWRGELLESLFSWIPDRIICNSYAVCDAAMKCLHPFPSMRVVWNGVETPERRDSRGSREGVRREWGVREDECLAGLVARMVPVKDHITFLRAAQRLVQGGGLWRFLCVRGGGSVYEKYICQQAERLGVGHRIVWIDLTPDIRPVYEALDLLCLTSRREGSPNVVGEAMSHGVPCVTTDVGDCARLVGDCGVVVPVGDDAALADGLRKMAGELKMRGDDLRRRCRERIRRGCGVDRLVENTVMVLNEVLGVNQGRKG
ncbi:MAG: glycosyltransferase [Verrucomicrobiae bacterium]|nr:glycosyltransferase [Verrucomicrobiae bacterium]